MPSASPAVTIGVAEAIEEQLFGEITDVELLEEGDIAVLDALSHDLRIFSADGKFLQRLGGAGSGPGELRSPQALAIAPDGDLFVTDLQRRLTRFRAGPDGYEFLSSTPLPFSIRDVCFLGDDLILHGLLLTDSYALHRLGPTGEVDQSFAVIYTSPNPLVNVIVSEGRIACDNEAGLIYFAPKTLLGEVRAYRRDGSLAWRTVIQDFQSNRISDTPDGGYAVESSPDGAHTLHTIEVLPGRGVLLQYSYRSPQELRDREPARADITVLLDRSDGSAVVADQPWPLIGAVQGDTAWAMRILPYPQLFVLHLLSTANQ